LSRLIAKGGATSSKFVFDSASHAIKDVVRATAASRAATIVLALSQPKGDRGKVLLCTAMSTAVETAPPGAFEGKDVLQRTLKLLDAFLHDAHPDVREIARRTAAHVAQYAEDSGQAKQFPVVVRKAIPDGDRAAKLIAASALSGDAGPAAIPQALVKAQPNTARGVTSVPIEKPATRKSISPEAPTRMAPTSPCSDPPSPKRSDQPIVLFLLEPAARGSGSTASFEADALSPHANMSFAGFGPANRGLSPPPSVSPRASAEPRAFGAPSESLGPSHSMLFTGTSSLMATDGTNHGPYGNALHLVSEGNASERQEGLASLLKMIQLLAAQLPSEELTVTASVSDRGHPLYRPDDSSRALTGASTDPQLLSQATQYAIADVVAIRCADPNTKVQLLALEVTPPLMRVMSAAAVDSTSSRWVSCITSALGSSHVQVAAAARRAMQTLLLRSTDANLRSLLSTLCMTVTGARNVNTKVTLLTAIADVVMRHRSLLSRAAQQPASLQKTVVSSLVLSTGDLAFATEAALRTLSTDPRPEVQRANAVLLGTLYEHAFDWDEKHILDNPRLTREQWTIVKSILADRARSSRSPQAGLH